MVVVPLPAAAPIKLLTAGEPELIDLSRLHEELKCPVYGGKSHFCATIPQFGVQLLGTPKPVDALK